MILLISTCKEKLHELEFVKPVEKLVGKEHFVRHYLELNEEDLFKADKVIICGTSLMDFGYLKKLEKFEWIKNFQKPVLGICAGSQIIHLIFEGTLVEDLEIGETKVRFEDFLGISRGEYKVYTLHKKLAYSEEFNIYAESDQCFHACKHRSKEIYTCLFHPEVYNPEIIKGFVKLNN